MIIAPNIPDLITDAFWALFGGLIAFFMPEHCLRSLEKWPPLHRAFRHTVGNPRAIRRPVGAILAGIMGVALSFPACKSVASHQQELAKGELFTYKDELVSGTNKVIVTTYCSNDSLSEQEAWKARLWPVALTQKVTFYEKDKEKAVFGLPLNKVFRETTGGQLVESASLIINEVGFIQAKGRIYWGIFEARSLCNGRLCPTYDDVFELTGEPLYQLRAVDGRQLLRLGNRREEILLDDKTRHIFDSVCANTGLTP